MKSCSKCGETKNLAEFCKHGITKDGLSYLCRDCSRKRAEEYYQKNKDSCIERVKKYRKTKAGREVHLKYNKRYIKTENGKEAQRRKDKKYAALNPEKIKARNAVNNAISSGRLKRKPCEICGSTKNIETHHEDYLKKIDVKWWCRDYHVAYHK